MNSEGKKIKLIVDELLSNSLEADATDIKVNIEKDQDGTIIRVSDNGKGMDQETLEKSRRTLKQPYRKDLEEYYGNLAGMEIAQGGLNIVGMQVDFAEIESSPQGTTITVKRKNIRQSKWV